MHSDPFDTDLIRSFGGSLAEGQEAYAEVYGHLRRVASASLRAGGPPTLHATALVNEAWLKLRDHLGRVRNREHFLALAALAMRQILSDHARARRAERRDARCLTVSVNVPGPPSGNPGSPQVLDLIALDDALTKLSTLKARHARVVELRFLCSLTIPETAEILGVSHATVESDWSMAQAWLRNELAER